MGKILFYVSSLNRGGAERVLVAVMNYCKEKYEVVLVTDVYAEDEYELPVGVRRICLTDTNHYSSNRYVAMVQRILAIRKVCVAEKAALGVAFMSTSGIRLETATKFMKMKTAIAIRNNPEYDLRQKKRRRQLLSAMHTTDAVIFQMASQQEYFDEDIRRKSFVILNPVNERFCNVKPPECRSNKIVTVGRLFDYKNHKLLIQAFADVRENYPDVQLYIYGEGPYRAETERLIQELQLEERVFLPGAETDVAERIKDARIFVLPSDTEGMPNTLIEAMILGLPVISTDCPCGGPRTLIEHGNNGLLVPMNDRVAMAKALDTLLADKEYAERLGKQAKQLINLCNEEAIKKQWLFFVEKMLETK